ncbi:unnamed protein product [Paramecium pentaurelia]|uniref:Uncharacterized protein n=1 Tax=Paramecium pentaurelia TaxID=43138 RepID=A0A8S1SSP9_9CILI|nr:unnamed protein product [Paramecium pentaurelia]
MIKLGHMLAREQARLRSEMEVASKQKKFRNATASTFYPNISKTSTLLQKSQVSPINSTNVISYNCSPTSSPKYYSLSPDPDKMIGLKNNYNQTTYKNKLETVQMAPNKPPLKRVNKLNNLRNINNNNLSQPHCIKNEESKEKLLEQTHFLSGIMQQQHSATGKIVANFLNGNLEKNSYESIIQMEKSAQALQQSAKEMSKALYASDDEGEFENLQNKFIDQIRFSKYRKPNQEKNIVFKRNYGQKHEMLIDQVSQQRQKSEENQDFDVFIPKSQMDQFFKIIQDKIDGRMKEQTELLLKEEQKLVNGMISNVKKFREDLREVKYTMSHVRKNKKALQSQQQQPQSTLRTLKTMKSQSSARLQSEKVTQLDEEAKADLKLRVMKALRNFMEKLKRFNITLDDVVNNQVFPSQAYERPNSVEFFRQVKADNIREIEGMLRDCRFHVYDRDNQQKTALHHAVNINSIEAMKLLVENGADLDARDMMGRTPLHIAAKNNNCDTVRVLLVYQANPSIKTVAGKTAQDLTEMPVIKALVKNAKKLHFMMNLQPNNKKKDFWVEKAIVYFQEDDPEKILKLQLYKNQAKLFLQ